MLARSKCSTVIKSTVSESTNAYKILLATKDLRSIQRIHRREETPEHGLRRKSHDGPEKNKEHGRHRWSETHLPALQVGYWGSSLIDLLLQLNEEVASRDVKISEDASLPYLEKSKSMIPNASTPAIGKPILPQTNLNMDLIGWDSQDDPAMPLNFPGARKWLFLGLVSAMSFLSPLTSTLPAPGVSLMDIEFHNTSPLLSSFVISVFVLGI